MSIAAESLVMLLRLLIHISILLSPAPKTIPNSIHSSNRNTIKNPDNSNIPLNLQFKNDLLPLSKVWYCNNLI